MKKLIYIFSLLAGLLLVLQCTHESISPKEAVELFPETGASPLPFLDGLSYRNSPSLSGDTRHKSSNTLDMEVVEELLEKAREQTGSSLVALFSVQDSTESWYSYHVQKLKFSDAAMQEAAGGTEPYFFEVLDYKGEVKRIAMAYIPKGALARKEMDNWIIPKRQRETMATKRMERTEKTLAVTGSTEMCFVEDTRYYIYNSSGELLHTIIVGHYEPCATATPDGGGDGSGGGGWGWPGDDYEDGQICPDGCEDSGGGGTSQPDVNPCDEPNPPAWCECEDTGNEVLDNKALQAVYEDLWNKQNSSDKEQGGFLYMNELNSYSFFELTDQFVTVRTKYKLEFHLPSGLPPGSIYIHTHPNENNITDIGITRRYKHKPSDEDKDMIEQMDHVVDYGLIIDPLYRIVYDSDGNTVIKATRCGY